MAGKTLKPGDPEVVAYVVDRIRGMSREELVGRFRSRADFDEAWLQSGMHVRKCHAGSGKKFQFRKRGLKARI